MVIDPNSDHVHLDSLAIRTTTRRKRLGIAGVARGRRRGGGPAASTATHTLCADFSDLSLDMQAAAPSARSDRRSRRVHQPPSASTRSSSGSYSIIDDLASPLHAGPRTRRRSPTAVKNLGIDRWDFWRRGRNVDRRLRRSASRCIVVDIGSLPVPTRTGVRSGRRSRSSAVDGHAAAIVSRSCWRSTRRTTCCQSNTDDPILRGHGRCRRADRRRGSQVRAASVRRNPTAGQGAPNVVSQCDNLVLMRMNGVADVDDLTTLFSHVPAPMLRRAISFGLGQALFAGADRRLATARAGRHAANARRRRRRTDDVGRVTRRRPVA